MFQKRSSSEKCQIYYCKKEKYMLSGNTSFNRKHPYLVISEPNIPGEKHSQPVAARRHVHALGQLLQNWKVTGLEVVSQSDMKLLLMGLHMNIWTKMSIKKKRAMFTFLMMQNSLYIL